MLLVNYKTNVEVNNEFYSNINDVGSNISVVTSVNILTENKHLYTSAYAAFSYGCQTDFSFFRCAYYNIRQSVDDSPSCYLTENNAAI